MSAQQKSKQSASRWGWMSQAVASVESGLDKILAEEDEASKKPVPKPTRSQENGTPSRTSSEARRSDSTNRTNDRLQARLAQAMAKKGASRPATPQPGSETPVPEKTDQPESQVESQRTSEDGTGKEEPEAAENILNMVGIPTLDATASPAEPAEEALTRSVRSSKDTPRDSLTVARDPPNPSTDSARLSNEALTGRSVSDAGADSDTKILNVQLEHEKSLSTLQEEINRYLERIDALQRNMQMLTRKTIEEAKQLKDDEDSSSHAKQLAERDEKIALLIDEGTKLTKGEMQYRNIIKKLRAETSTATKEQAAVRQRAEKAERSLSTSEARAIKAEREVKKAAIELATLSKSSSDAEAITKERNDLQSTLAEVRSQLSRANKRAEEAESKAQSEKLDIERRKNAELQDDLSSAKVERDLTEDKSKREIEGLKEALKREKEQARQLETEMLAEQAALESRLESFRVRAEEASSGDQGEPQAKLLRQIETLQNQYSAASQNWQGIETRITALEKERDEVVGREADLRRKLRDTTAKTKSATRELEAVQQSLNVLQDQQDEQKAEEQKVTKRTVQLEDELSKLKKDLEDQRLRAEKDMVRRIEEERVKWLASVSQSNSRIDSPAASLRKGGHFFDNLMSPQERPISRPLSQQPFHDYNLHSRINSSTSIRANGAMPRTPSIHVPDDQDDFFANVPATPASAVPTQAESGRAAINDVISASTAGAGPSVQLVERLSTNVRRLESEKAASKDEIVRLSSQRDEARQEVVNLMREIESKRAAEDRLSKVEGSHSALSKQYERTLELLGEKTELVEELKADIADVKAMYRHLADTMGKS
ncbi:hypothetical protein LTR70_007156 [Exophiala xenobiotica]|uniref:TATA element modulatory factor 1 TATA binding domain-containing protein n=1 Tax=Lithohypha guttulata TaxID=1690604 RepID=A0ABR0KHB6_9EURO|nr:hypothetical protein LTR24_003243 [Lithohypha guttulata]KAK5314441.1 hypothetical protein LTR70_007156 [Exophiala xenobiotica]